MGKQQTAREGQDASPSTAATTRSENPYKDCTVFMLALSFSAIATLMTGAMGLLVPQMLFTQPSFGIAGQGKSETEMSSLVAQAMGLLSLPNGLASLFTNVFLYSRLTDRFGEGPVLGVAGVIATIALPCYQLTHTLGQVFVCHGVVGASFGFFLPAVAPMMSRYGEAFYPNSKAQLQAV